MTDPKLRTALHPIVKEYGLGTVLRYLAEIADARKANVERPTPPSNGNSNGSKQRRPKVTAREYVEKMELPLEKSAAVTELAERFQHKSFLPTFHDVTEFCQVYGIEVPASRSRMSAIPRVFKFIADMETNEVQRILDDGMFSGPSKLAPIADAIRNYSRAASR